MTYQEQRLFDIQEKMWKIQAWSGSGKGIAIDIRNAAELLKKELVITAKGFDGRQYYYINPKWFIE